MATGTDNDTAVGYGTVQGGGRRNGRNRNRLGDEYFFIVLHLPNPCNTVVVVISDILSLGRDNDGADKQQQLPQYPTKKKPKPP